MKKNLILTAIAVLCCAMISCSKDDTTPQGAGNPEPVVISETPDLTEGWSRREDLTEYFTEEWFQTGLADTWAYTPSESLTSADLSSTYGTDDYLLFVMFDANGVSTSAVLIFGSESQDEATAVATGINAQFGTSTSIPSLPSSTGAVLVELNSIAGCAESLTGKALTVIQTTLGADIDNIIRDWISAFRVTPDLGEDCSMTDIYTLKFAKTQTVGIGKEAAILKEESMFVFDETGVVQSARISLISDNQGVLADLISNSSADFRLAVANLTEEIPRGWYGFDITIGALEIVRPPKQDGSTGSINNPFTGKTRAEIAALTGPTGTLLAANMDKPGKL